MKHLILILLIGTLCSTSFISCVEDDLEDITLQAEIQKEVTDDVGGEEEQIEPPR